MHTSRNVTPFYIMIASMCCLQVLLAWSALGGPDVETYWRAPFSIYWPMFYYWKEPLAWGLIAEISMLSSRLSFILNISLAILALSIIFLGRTRGFLLYAAFLSPFGIMLSFNVLRQGFATVFLAAALLHISENKPKSAAILSLLAVLFHNFSIVIIIPAAFMFIFLQIPRHYRLLVMGSAFLILMLLGATGSIEALVSERSGLTSELRGEWLQHVIYAGFAAVITSALFFYVPFHKNVSAGMLLGLASFGLLIPLFGLGYWTFGRIGISVILISTFLCFESFVHRGYNSRLFPMLVYVLAVIGPLIIMLHPGAMSMIE